MQQLSEAFRSLPKPSEAFTPHQAIGTSSAGRCMRPGAPFLAHAAALGLQPAAPALRDVLPGRLRFVGANHGQCVAADGGLGRPGTGPLRRPGDRQADRAEVREVRSGPHRSAAGTPSAWAKIAKLAKFCKFLAGSFSAVSKRNFARKYAFDSIFRALQDLHISNIIFAPLQFQNFSTKSV